MKTKKPFNCGFGPLFDTVGGRWKAAILWELSQQELRFSEIRQNIGGITEKMLMEQLRELEHDKLIIRKDYQEKPLRVGYALTKEGGTINNLLVPLANWGRDYAEKLGTTNNYSNVS